MRFISRNPLARISPAKGNLLPPTSSTARACLRSTSETRVRDELRGRYERFARRKASTCMIRDRDAKAGVRRFLAAPRILVCFVGITEVLPNRARRQVNTRNECGRSPSRASITGPLASSVMPMECFIWSAIKSGGAAHWQYRDRILIYEGRRQRLYGDQPRAPSLRLSARHPRFNYLKKSLPLSSMMMKAGKSTTSMRQIVPCRVRDIPSSRPS